MMALARRLARGLLGGVLAAATVGALAHSPSDAHLHLQRLADGTLEQRLDVPLRDLDRELDLDADRDGALTWGELRARWDAVERLVDETVVVRSDGSPCLAVARQAPRLVDHGDGRYAVLQRTLGCADAAGGAAEGSRGVVSVEYRLFLDSDPSHRGLLRLGSAAEEESLHVLVPGAAPTTVVPGMRPLSGGGLGFFLKGLHHIAIGLDHVLFLVTLLMVAVWRRDGAAWKPQPAAGQVWLEALRLVTAFTVAHSITLGLAAAGVFAPPARWVESLIAASVFVAAVDNLRPFLPGPRWMTVAVFGLVHGFGFAGPLQDLGLQGAGLAVPLLAFNLGVEAGQLLVVGLFLPVALALRASAGYGRWFVRPGSALVAGLALLWTFERVLDRPLLAALV